jgi:hypothetical protein|tara:strand:- start:6277 stop:6540 length:264 start_codon:yes stop_codon:yes gene_type:complete
MSKLVPGAVLIYERADGVTYARYRDPPHNKMPRWIIGGEPESVSKAQGNLFSYSEWQDMMELANEYPTLRKQLQTAVTTYYIVKDNK